ncbi:hypothetical protein PA598K_04853 [Paenibacillus sp. 598K]|uniref:nucleoside triphosphate pyrophosphohydrolase n=1 Tax=Paenibacillus sp. 598K TaxID=1117987 RepID=UPI000FF975F1|nr:nucleoside triphosphate pyrophosphohydrolase [Paenibacillus sp. 598K]GBF76387.1 hypothetical protein PA598K_04853 [Paenibacillus sp. 598K]
MPAYNKLVRDNIPQIIARTGATSRTRILGDEEYLQELQTKLREETAEYMETTNAENALEELADVLEVVRALAVAHGADWEQLESIRQQKAEQRGGFRDKVYLIDVDES